MRSLSASLILTPLPRLLGRRDRSVPHLNRWNLMDFKKFWNITKSL